MQKKTPDCKPLLAPTILGLICAVLFLSDVDEELDINISSNGSGRRLPTSARHQHSSNRSVQRVTESRLENVRPGQMIRTKEFGVLWATFFLNTQVPISRL